MKRDATVENVELFPLGEIAMGSEAYGITIETNFGKFEQFKEIPILVGHEDYTQCIEQSKCTRYLILKAVFGTYVLDMKDQKISVYKITLRGENREWSEENAIFGKETEHLSGFSRHYFLQFPFIKKSEFWEKFETYEKLRKTQIEEMVNAAQSATVMHHKQ